MTNQVNQNLEPTVAGSQLNPEILVAQLVKDLPERTKNILVKRYGLDGSERKTLEEIGRSYGITRERVRQIESLALKELKKSSQFKKLQPLIEHLHNLLDQYGQLMERRYLMRIVSKHPATTEANDNVIEFILHLADNFKFYSEDPDRKKAWGTVKADSEKPKELINQLARVLEENKKPLSQKEAVKIASNLDFAREYESLSSPEVVGSYLELSKKILKNPYNEWGLNSWNEIVPRGVKDKAYIVLKRTNKPLHFTEITDLINDAGFGRRKALPQTVHNELIKDRRFVLVGRGIYALKEWGYKPGTVADVVAGLLAEEKQPLTKTEIIDRVLKQRVVKKNTVVLALQNRTRFQKVSPDKYTLKAV